VDWQSLAERARGLNLKASSPAELEKLLLGGGLSTAAEVTDLSGRGIGVGALAAATTAMGGEFKIKSAPGKGTTLSMTFPASCLEPAELGLMKVQVRAA
jgi:two-component system chemotaxis sensor kinase CheA